MKTLEMDIKKLSAYNFIPKGIKELVGSNMLGFNSGFMIHGKSGTGKSGTLGYITMWAHKANWFVVNVPSVHKWTHKGGDFVRHHDTRMYISFEIA